MHLIHIGSVTWDKVHEIEIKTLHLIKLVLKFLRVSYIICLGSDKGDHFHCVRCLSVKLSCKFQPYLWFWWFERAINNPVGCWKIRSSCGKSCLMYCFENEPPPQFLCHTRKNHQLFAFELTLTWKVFKIVQKRSHTLFCLGCDTLWKVVFWSKREIASLKRCCRNKHQTVNCRALLGGVL